MVQGIGRIVLLLALIGQSSGLVGQLTWRRCYGALADDRGVVARAASENLIMAVGSTGSFGNGSSDTYLIATDGAGARLWSRTIGGSAVDRPTAMRICANGDLIIAGITAGDGGYDGSLVRTDANGEIIWSRTYGGSDWDMLYDVKELADGGLLLAGQTYSSGEPGGNAWVLRTNAQGDLLWSRAFGGSGEHEARSVVATPDGGAVLAGSLATPERDRDVLVIKLDANGDTEWIQVHGGDSLDVARDIILAPGGGYSLVGTTKSHSVWNEGLHMWLYPDGSLKWQFNWGQINDQEFYEHLLGPNDEFFIAGYTKTAGAGAKDMVLQRVTVNGGFIYGRTFGGSEDEDAFSVDTIGDGYLLMGSTTSYGAGGSDLFMVRTDADGFTSSGFVQSSFDPLSVDELNDEALPLMLFPNPSSGEFEFSANGIPQRLTILDALGRMVESRGDLQGATEHSSALPSGLYTVEILCQGGELRRGRIIIERP